MTPTKQAAGVLMMAAGIGLLMVPGARRLPKYHPTTVNGVKTNRDAVIRCRQTGLAGWALVAYAQQLVYRKFAVYTTLNLWDPPNHAFVVGMGYCTQYNLALKHILDQLGFSTQAVFSLKVQVVDNPEWIMGHTWLRVTLDGETRDVCAGRLDNFPGKVHFVPLSGVLPGHPLTLFLTHLGMILFVCIQEWQALLARRPSPDWTYKPRLPEQF
ncbi:MAG: hypothetical protein KC441_14905 [Anaerolineales bacterium]|nr:hypothetical protein [Anaerolineales bacterium]